MWNWLKSNVSLLWAKATAWWDYRHTCRCPTDIYLSKDSKCEVCRLKKRAGVPQWEMLAVKEEKSDCDKGTCDCTNYYDDFVDGRGF